MGQEVNSKDYSNHDFESFYQTLKSESQYLEKMLEKRYICSKAPLIGIEVEAWLVDKDYMPSASAPDFLRRINDEQIVAEIAQYNFEINSNPYDLQDGAFAKLEKELKKKWDNCTELSSKSFNKPVMIGTLPTLREQMLNLSILSPQNRYRLMNREIMKQRQGKPIIIHLEAKDALYIEMDSVIAECAATSLQTHYGVNKDNAVRSYNASLIASSLSVALGANSPLFFGKELWDESRIIVFEHAVNLECFQNHKGDAIKRVTFGNEYIQKSWYELFDENLYNYPILLPDKIDASVEQLKNLHLHNGTIWRWNRPIVAPMSNGNISMRIEHRAPSSGPTVVDTIGNSMFFIGLTHYLASLKKAPERSLSFQAASQNFYQAARQSFYAQIEWIDGKRYKANELIRRLLPYIRESLKSLGVSRDELSFYFDQNIRKRVEKSRNGAIWQKAFLHSHGADFQRLLGQYIEYQQKNKSIHTWSI